MNLNLSAVLLLSVVCSMLLVVDGHWWWRWRRRYRCYKESRITVVSSDCSKPLDGVRISAWRYLRVVSSSGGVYTIRACRLPIFVILRKPGFRSVRRLIRHSAETVTMTCTGSRCTTEKLSVSVMSSECINPLQGVIFASPHIISVCTHKPGIYTLEVCAIPLEVTFERPGYESLTETITDTSVAVQMTCTGTTCSTPKMLVTFTSDCTPTVVGVTIKSKDILAVSNPAPGLYEISACISPILASVEPIGYLPFSASIENGSVFKLGCIVAPIMVEHPQRKYRAENEDVKLCCRTGPATAIFVYQWFKDETAIEGETSNELMLTSLALDDQGLYKCSATNHISPPAISQEAFLTVSENSDSCSNARKSNYVYFAPGCSRDIGQCENRACRSDPSSTETCTDDNICCEITSKQTVDCGSGVQIPVDVVVACSCSCPAPLITISGTVDGSDTDLPLAGVTVSLSGGLGSTTTDVNGQYSLSVPSTVRNVVIKADDPANKYIDAFHVQAIPSETVVPVTADIVMIRKAPFIEIDPSTENVLSLSNDPADINTGPASLVLPANAFFNSDGTLYNETVFTSLTFLDPQDPETLEVIPGQFITLNSEGDPDILITQGVFSIQFNDNIGNTLVINEGINVYGTPGFALWQLDEESGTWIPIKNSPSRRRRQVSQQEFIDAFDPRNATWFNIDRVDRQPDCFFKVRIFDRVFAPENEIKSGLSFIPKVSQYLADLTEVIKYYYLTHTETSCFRIKCPSDAVPAKISVIGTTFRVQMPLLAASLDDYSANIRNVLEAPPYLYSILVNDPFTIFVNTLSSSSGPFYDSKQTCDASTLNEPAFWFIKQTRFMGNNFYDNDFQGRCIAKAKIFLVRDANLTAVSFWSNNSYGIKFADIYKVESNAAYASCFEYRCSMQNDTFTDKTSVILGLSNSTYVDYNCTIQGAFVGYAKQRRGKVLYAPVLYPAHSPHGFFYSDTGDTESAMASCRTDSGNYAVFIHCEKPLTTGGPMPTTRGGPMPTTGGGPMPTIGGGPPVPTAGGP